MSLVRHLETVPIEWIGGASGLEAADVEIAPGVSIELATLRPDAEEPAWGVWGVRIDGKLYREPRDLEPEPLAEGPFREAIERRAATEGRDHRRSVAL